MSKPRAKVGHKSLGAVRGGPVDQDVGARAITLFGGEVARLVVSGHPGEELYGGVAVIRVGGGDVDALDDAGNVQAVLLSDADGTREGVPVPARFPGPLGQGAVAAPAGVGVGGVPGRGVLQVLPGPAGELAGV